MRTNPNLNPAPDPNPLPNLDPSLALSPFPKPYSPHTSRRFRRRAMTVLELTVALFILTTAMVAIVQLVATTATQRRAIEQRRIALQEIANQAERIALMSWDETAPGLLTSWQPSSDLSAVLPQATCTAQITDEAGSPTYRRIRLLLIWPNAAGQPLESTLTIWKFRPEAQP
jgi:hypothetical protein